MNYDFTWPTLILILCLFFFSFPLFCGFLLFFCFVISSIFFFCNFLHFWFPVFHFFLYLFLLFPIYVFLLFLFHSFCLSNFFFLVLNIFFLSFFLSFFLIKTTVNRGLELVLECKNYFLYQCADCIPRRCFKIIPQKGLLNCI